MDNLEISLENVERKLENLKSISIPELSNCTGPVSLHTELNDTVRRSLQTCSSELADLRVSTYSLLLEQRKALTERLETSERELESLRKAGRIALQKSSKNLVSRNPASIRAALLGSQSKDLPLQAKNSQENALTSATSEVTNQLMQTVQLLQQELDRSALSNQMLEQSTTSLGLTTQQYDIYSNVLDVSKQLITALEKADFLDRLIILAAALFFVLICSWIVKKRIVDKSVRIAGSVFSPVTWLIGMGTSHRQESADIQESEVTKDPPSFSLIPERETYLEQKISHSAESSLAPGETSKILEDSMEPKEITGLIGTHLQTGRERFESVKTVDIPILPPHDEL